VLLAIKANVLAIQFPLLNEPGVHRSHSDFETYHDIIAFKNMEVAVWETALEVSKGEGAVCAELRQVVAREFLKKRESLKKRLVIYAAKCKPRVVSTHIYNMETTIDYSKLLGVIKTKGPHVHKLLKEIAEIDV
jgi:hypothetical protein